MRLPFRKYSNDVPVTVSISDPLIAEWLGLTVSGIEGITVTEQTAMGIPAFARAVAIISGAIAQLPLKAYRDVPNGVREPLETFLTNNPAGPYALSEYTWKQMVATHLAIYGEAFLAHVYDGAGALVGMFPVHPSVMQVTWQGFGKKYTYGLLNGDLKECTQDELTHLMLTTIDGLRGIGPLILNRRTIALAIASEKASARLVNGMHLAGLVTPEGDLDETEAKAIHDSLREKMMGVDHAGDIAVINRALKFTPWQQTAEQAQFMAARSFQVEEIARIFGIPSFLLNLEEKNTSWGSGIAAQQVGLQRHTLARYTTCIEEGLSELLWQGNRFVEFDWTGFLQADPITEITTLLAEVKGELLTVDEARAIRNLPPKPKEKEVTPPPTPAMPPVPPPTPPQEGVTNE